jgi:hypothetical protein
LTPVPEIVEAAPLRVDEDVLIETVGRVSGLEISIPAAGAAKVIRTGADDVALIAA